MKNLLPFFSKGNKAFFIKTHFMGISFLILSFFLSVQSNLNAASKQNIGSNKFIVNGNEASNHGNNVQNADDKYWEQFKEPGVQGADIHDMIVANGKLYAVGGFNASGGDSKVRYLATFDGENWSVVGGGFICNACATDVSAIATDKNGDIFIGGLFNSVVNPNGDEVPSKNIAMWDNTNKVWISMGELNSPRPTSITVVGDSVYVGGDFTQVTQLDNSTLNVNRIAVWDMQNKVWKDLDGGVGSTKSYVHAKVETIKAYHDTLYIGGSFTYVATDSLNAAGIAIWTPQNGISGFTSGVTTNSYSGSVYDIDIDTVNKKMYVGGYFDHAGQIKTTRIAGWDLVNHNWFQLNDASSSTEGVGESDGNAGSSIIYMVKVDQSNGDVYVGGSFLHAGVYNTNHIAMWNNNTWDKLSSGLDNYPEAGAFYKNKLYFGGRFIKADTITLNHFTSWDGNKFLPIGRGPDYDIYSVCVDSPYVYFGGNLQNMGGVDVNAIARMNMNTGKIDNMGGGVTSGGYPGTVHAISKDKNYIYVTGNFSTLGLITANNVARWNISTEKWEPLGYGSSNGIDGYGSSIKAFNGKVYVSGNFSSAGQVTCKNLAVFDNSSGTWSKVGGGLVGSYEVKSFATSGDSLIFMGGTFQKVEQTGGDQLDAKCFVKWNTKTKMWEKFHGDISGYNNRVNSIQIDSLTGFIYIGGYLSQIKNDDQTTIDPNNVAMWDGTKWTTLASGVYGRTLNDVESMTLTAGGDLYVGGRFSNAVNYTNSVSSNNIAKWNGQWSGLGSALSGGSHVYAMAASKSGVWVSGDFKEAGGLPSYQLAKWSGPGTQPVYYTSDLSEINTVQPQFGPSYGTVDATLLGNRLSISGNFKFYKGKFDTAYVSMEEAGVNGNSQFGLNPELTNKMRDGNFISSQNTFILNQSQMTALQQNKLYVSVVSDSTPAGIMRGQILPKPNTAPAGPQNLMPKNDTLITIEGNPNQKLNFSWDSSTDPNNNKVVYVWSISPDPEFTAGHSIFGVNTDTATHFSISYRVVDSLLVMMHAAPGQIDTLYHRIIATDGSDYDIGQTNRLLLRREILGATAQVQLVNNSPDPDADTLKVMLNGFDFYPYFNYRKASPFIKVPADSNLIFTYVNGKGNTIFTDTTSFYEGENSIMVLSGLTDASKYQANPDNRSIDLMNIEKFDARLVPSTKNKIDVCTIHGITDLGKATVTLDNSTKLGTDLEFGDTTAYKTLDVKSYNGNLSSSEDSKIGLSFTMDVSKLLNFDDYQDSVFALILSGFNDPQLNNSNSSKTLLVVFPHGLTTQLDLITGVKNQKQIPVTYSLSQNYPNPFNPSTTIKYSLRQTSNVSLLVYNILGKKVKTLVSEKQSAGYHSINFDASNLASGIYFYELKAGNKFTAYKKMILLK